MKKIGTIVGGLVVVLVALVVAGVAVLKSMDFNAYKGLIAEEAEKATGRKLVIAGDLNLEISLNPALAVEGVTFANASWGSRPEMAKLKRLEAQVALLPLIGGQVRVERLVLEGLDLLAETDTAGRGNWEFGEPPPKAEAKSKSTAGGGPLPVVNLVELKDIKVIYKDGKTGETITAALDYLEMVAKNATTPLHFKVAGAYNGAPYKASGKLGSIDALIGGKALPVKAAVEALGAMLAVEGRIADPMAAKGLDLSIKLDVPSPPDTVKAAAAIVPGLEGVGPVPALPIAFDGKVQDVPGGYAVQDMKLTVGGNDLAGRLAVYIGGARPRIDADLVSSRFNVDELLPKQEKAAEVPARAEPAVGSGKTRVFSADPLPLDGLKAADVNIKFQGKALIAQGMPIENVNLALSLAEGRLVLKPFGFGIFGGTVGGNLALDGSRKTPTLGLDLDIKQVDYGKVLEAQGLKDIAKGKVDARIDVKGTGASVRALMAGLSGKARVVTQGGRIESNALNILSADVASALPMVKSEGDKDIRCGVIHFNVTKGQAKARAIVFETGGISVVGTGRVNLATEGLDLRIDPKARKSSLIKLAMMPIMVGGVMADPSVTPDTVETVKAVATVVGAVATGGLSVLGQAVMGETSGNVDDTDYCKLALAGKTVVRRTPEASKKTAAPDSKLPSQQPRSVEDAVKGVGESLGKSLKGLFRN